MAKTKKRGEDFFQSLFGIRERIWVYFFGLLFVGTLSAISYEFIHDADIIGTEAVRLGSLLRCVLLVVLTFLFAASVYCRYRRKEQTRFEAMRRQFAPVRETAEIPITHSSRGLIWLFSPLNPTFIVEAISKHKQGFSEDFNGGRLEVCWCIMSREKPYEEEAKRGFQEIEQYVEKQGFDIILKPVWVDHAEVIPVFDKVNQIYEQEIPQVNKELENAGKPPLKTEDVISDISSGLRTMSAGMLLACIHQNRPVEYVKADYDERNRIIKATVRIVKIETSMVFPKFDFK